MSQQGEPLSKMNEWDCPEKVFGYTWKTLKLNWKAIKGVRKILSAWYVCGINIFYHVSHRKKVLYLYQVNIIKWHDMWFMYHATSVS